MRRFIFVTLLVLFGFLGQVESAETYNLTTGETVTGEMLPTSGNDVGVQIKIGDGEYQRVPWVNFSQEDLKKFATNNRLQQFVEPFIDISQEERMAKTEVNVKQPERLQRPIRQSLLAAMFGSGVGIVLLLAIYAANIYAGYEIAIFRAQPIALVCGVAAILPIIGPIVFLSMPTKMRPGQQTSEAPQETAAEEANAATGNEDTNPMLNPDAEHPAGLKIHREGQDAGVPAAPLPPTTTYARGQFTINRRFFETRFPGFFGPQRPAAEKEMVLLFKCTQRQVVCTRIARVGASDIQVDAQSGGITQDLTIQFQEILEVQLKHKDAP